MADEVKEEELQSDTALVREYMKACIIAGSPYRLDSLSDEELRAVWIASGRAVVPYDQWLAGLLGQPVEEPVQAPQKSAPKSFTDDPQFKEAQDQINNTGMSILRNEAKHHKGIIKVEEVKPEESKPKQKKSKPKKEALDGPADKS